PILSAAPQAQACQWMMRPRNSTTRYVNADDAAPPSPSHATADCAVARLDGDDSAGPADCRPENASCSLDYRDRAGRRRAVAARGAWLRAGRRPASGRLVADRRLLQAP